MFKRIISTALIGITFASVLFSAESIELKSESNGGFIDFSDDLSLDYQWRIWNNVGTFNIYDNYDGAPKIRLSIQKGGYVGIGTTTPTAKLTVGNPITNVAGSTIASFGGSSSDEVVALSLLNTHTGAENNSVSIGFHNYKSWGPTGKIQLQQTGISANSRMNFFTYGEDGFQNRMSISSNGYVGISNSSPQRLLTIGGENGKRGIVGLKHTDGYGWAVNTLFDGGFGIHEYKNTDWTIANCHFTIQRGGNVSIGSPSTTGNKLNIDGRLFLGTLSSTTGAGIWYESKNSNNWYTGLDGSDIYRIYNGRDLFKLNQDGVLMLGTFPATLTNHGKIHIYGDGKEEGLAIYKDASSQATLRMYIENGNGYITRAGDNAKGLAITKDGIVMVPTKLEAQKIEVKNLNLPDYVFENEYNLRSLDEVEAFIAQNKHLPEVPSAKQVSEEGMDLTEMNNIMLCKIEELTLYMIEQDKEIELLKEQNQLLMQLLNK